MCRDPHDCVTDITFALDVRAPKVSVGSIPLRCFTTPSALANVGQGCDSASLRATWKHFPAGENFYLPWC